MADNPVPLHGTPRCGLSKSAWNPNRCPNPATHVLRAAAHDPHTLTVCTQHMEQFGPDFPHITPIDGTTDVGQTQPRWTVGDRLWWINKFTKTHSTAYDIAAEVIAEPTQLFMTTAPIWPSTGKWQYEIQFTERGGRVCKTWAREEELAITPPPTADR